MSDGRPSGDGRTAAPAPRPRRARGLAAGAVLALAVIAAVAWLTSPKGSAPAIEERVVALPVRPPAISPEAAPSVATPPAATPAPATPPAPALPAAPSAVPDAVASPASAEPAPGQPAFQPPPPIPVPEPAAAAQPAPVPPSLLPPSLGALDGFGSARFEMTEQEVRDAIDQDFPSAATGRRRVGLVAAEADRVFLTRALLASVREVLPDTGSARVEYVLGYQRRRLIQVNVIWGSQADPPTPRADVEAVAARLQDFVARTYGPNMRTTSGAQRDGSVVQFVGRTPQGRMVELASSLRVPQRYWVRLSYVQDPQGGDVYRLPRGAF